MKKIFQFSAFVLSLFAFSSCEKCEMDCNLVAAKILRYDCDRVIFQILDNKTVGDAIWEDVHTGQLYTNVVSYYNTCKIAALTNGTMDTIYVSIKPPKNNQEFPDCYNCQAISQGPPQTKVEFQNISKHPCSSPMVK